MINALEQLNPHAQPNTDRAIKRLHRYGMDAKWLWSSERAMALDLAELVEDMEAAKQRGDAVGLQFRAALVSLVSEKLDMDRGRELLEILDQSKGKERIKIFQKLRDGTLTGWALGLERAEREIDTLSGDPLIYYKGYANMELVKDRFVRPSSPTSYSPPFGEND